MKGNKQHRRENIKIFLKSAVLSAIAILLIIIGFFAAGYLLG